MKLPNVKSDYYALVGGLDLLTPAIALAPGKCFDAQNYEPEIGGGYRRKDGYERFSGQPSPTAAIYTSASINLTGAIAVGNTVTGATSAATGKVLAVSGTTLILGRVTGTFAASENFTIGGTVRGNFTSLPTASGAASPSDDADYALLAANDIRADIGVVPGSGPIRGVAVFNDLVYAFRDNAAATAGDMYKSSAAGWVKVNFGTEIQFTAGLAAGASVLPGDAINGATSGAAAIVVKVLLRAGAFDGTGVGTLILSSVTGTFTSGEVLREGATAFATSSSASTAISRLPGGQVETVSYNFTGSTATLKMYGADGVNRAFEFDGANYIPIRTGMAVDTPTHVIGHRNYLFLAFRGSVQFSGIFNPYAWSAVLGAGEIATGDTITGFLATGGNSGGTALAVFTAAKTFILYGSSSATFQLVPFTFDIGFASNTMQAVGNTSFGLTARGIQNLAATQSYGDFNYTAISKDIQPYLTARQGMQTASTTLRTKDQYRLFFSDGSALAIGLSPEQATGIMPLNYGMAVRAIVTANLSTGREATYFGSDSGYVYQDDIGTSFDGGVIEAYLRLPFNHGKSPSVRKRWRHAVVEARVNTFASVNISYDLGYGSPNVSPSPSAPAALLGAGGYWGQVNWGSFIWDAQVISDLRLTLSGTEKNISLLFYSSRAQDQAHVLQGITLMYTLQRQER